MNIQTNEFHGISIYDTFQDMSKVANYSVSSPPHPNMGGGNQSNKIPSHIIHPSPLHLDIVLWDLHTLKDIQGAQSHYNKLAEAKVDQHVMVPWEVHVPLPIKL
jgi:hypothetical protein